MRLENVMNGLRENINRHPRASISLLLLLVTMGIVLVVMSTSTPAVRPKVHLLYYSTDDGATWFADEEGKVPGFDHDGQPAYLAYVVTNDGGTTKWVNYLLRISEPSRSDLENLRASEDAQPAKLIALFNAGAEVKKPGEAKWVSQSSPRAQKVMTPRAPGGSTARIEPVYP
jgi:hypothetical protein